LNFSEKGKKIPPEQVKTPILSFRKDKKGENQFLRDFLKEEWI